MSFLVVLVPIKAAAAVTYEKNITRGSPTFVNSVLFQNFRYK
jgi:hypothetical protein